MAAVRLTVQLVLRLISKVREKDELSRRSLEADEEANGLTIRP